jgi:tripartite-type tricarboxylate transporter receptor subunit TctC
VSLPAAWAILGAAMKRRAFLQLAASAAALPALPHIANAQAYPTRPVRLIVGFAAGGLNDIAARLTGQWLSERLSQAFVVENRQGAGGNIATESVVRARPDGYTLLVIGSSNTINPTLYDNLNFNFLRDVAPVGGIIRVPLVAAVNPSVPAATLPELIAYAKARPGKINFASGGNGSSLHVAGELFKAMAGVDMVHVPYRGAGPALTDLLAGQVQVMFSNLPESVEYIRAGRLRGLAVTTATRAAALPDLPTVGDSVPGYEASGIVGVGAPRDTASDIVSKLNAEINAGLVSEKLRSRIIELGGEPMAMTPAAFGKLLVDEVEKWGKVIKTAGIKAE